jgi:hypothetical protein
MLECMVEIGKQTEIPRLAISRHAWVPVLLNQLPTIVRRSVIPDEELKILERLCEDALDTPREVPPTLVNR